MSATRKRLIWQGISAGAAALSVVAMQRGLEIGWRRVRHEPPPKDPTDQSASWGSALTWAIALGAGVAVARLVAVRLAEDVWEVATHEVPPDTNAEARS
jgi:hypothetical protein